MKRDVKANVAIKPEGHEKMLAAIRIRGSAGVPVKIEKTLDMLRLRRVNHCVIVPKTPDIEGMLRKAGNYITWGEINMETLETLISKRGRLQGGKKTDRKEVRPLTNKIIEGKKDPGIKPVFRLSPPSGGFRSIRRAYPKGDLGYRGENINELLKRMI